MTPCIASEYHIFPGLYWTCSNKICSMIPYGLAYTEHVIDIVSINAPGSMNGEGETIGITKGILTRLWQTQLGDYGTNILMWGIFWCNSDIINDRNMPLWYSDSEIYTGGWGFWVKCELCKNQLGLSQGDSTIKDRHSY